MIGQFATELGERHIHKRSTLVLGFIQTIHGNIALLLFPAKELSEHLADVRTPLFPLFYQVEIRHRQLLQ